MAYHLRGLMIAGISIFYCTCSLWAYDGDVHYEISKSSAEYSKLNSILMNNLGILNGIEEKFVSGKLGRPAWGWIAAGGQAEDHGYLGRIDMITTRAFNHFHDPLKEWDAAGLSNFTAEAIYYGSYLRLPVSPILWGLNPYEQDFVMNFTGDWSWSSARQHFYDALTTATREERDKSFADCFRALGHVMHLLQDMSVPLHTRNDVHIFPFDSLPELGPNRWTFETYTSKNIKQLDFDPDQPGDRPSVLLLTQPQAQSVPVDYTHLPAVSGLFDRNVYTGGGFLPNNETPVGLAEYSNSNFLTFDTLWKYPHPALSDSNFYDVTWPNSELISAEDGQPDRRIYLKYKDGVGAGIGHLAAAQYFAMDYQGFAEISAVFSLDEACWKDYADKLIPRAVGYSAALLDFFFRGRLSVKAAPVYGDDAVFGIRLSIKNTTESQETMEEGDFTLTCLYQDSASGEDRFATTPNLSLAEPLGFGGAITEEFSFPEPISIVDFGSIKCMLAFRGTLGNEEGAVIGKHLSLMKFNEDWDNGLTGNYAWNHTSTQPPNGVTYNEIEEDGSPAVNRLIKDNIRWEGQSSARVNESYFLLKDAEKPNGLYISPQTILQFKIDALSINVMPSEPSLTLQALMLNFNDGRKIQLSQPGQFLAFNNTTVYREFPLSVNISWGIYPLFQSYGVQIIEPLYLESISFIQQLGDLENPSLQEHHQHMEVDYLRITEPED